MKPLSAMPGDLKRRVEKIDKAIERSRRDSIRDAAQVAKAAQLDVMRPDSGGDLRLSRVRSGKGAKVGVKYTLTDTSATIKALGPVPLLASKIPGHRIPKSRGRRRVIAIPGIGVRAYANHPGTKGKDTWDRGREKAEPKIRTVIGRNTDTAVKKAFLSGG